MRFIAPAFVAAGLCAASVHAQSPFVNWETGHVSPIAVSGNGQTLAVANTPDNRVEVFAINDTGVPVHTGSVPVGLDPVSVRFNGPLELWCVNHISDSVSIIDLRTMNVRRTLRVGDEPGDVVFAMGRAFVSVGDANEVWVFDLANAVGPPSIVTIEGEDPRSLATDGTTVYALIMNAGNRTTVLNHSFVTNANNNPYPGDPNPVPNDGLEWNPPINPVLLEDADGDGEPDIRMPRESLILKMDDGGLWLDDNIGDWTAAVPWTMHGHALARIDAQTLAVSYTNDLMAINTALDVSPATGEVAVVGAHMLNHIRFEPNINGTFTKIGHTVVDGAGVGVEQAPVNPHLTEFFTAGPGELPPVAQLPHALRRQSLGDPQGVAWAPDGSYRLITGRGSNNIVKTAPDGTRIALLDVGQGPTGVRFHPFLPVAYVVNKFDATVSVVGLDEFVVLGTVDHFDPTPAVIRTGRPHFYNTIDHSGLGQASCQSCHVNGTNDKLSWNLGDPSGDVKLFNQVCIGQPEPCENENWHPMKGPMTTQTLQGFVGTEPGHWRGDREDLAAFNGAFESLLASNQISDQAMQEFEDFLATVKFPPNPHRNLDGSLQTSFSNGGDAQRGEFLFVTPPITEGAAVPLGSTGHVMMIPPQGPAEGGFNCAACHALPTGSNFQILRTILSDTITGIHHLTKTAQLRDLYKKDGFDVFAGVPMNRGTGFLHDGSYDTLDNFLAFFFGMDVQDRLDVTAFLMSFGTDTHAGIGAQVTLGGPGDGGGGDTLLRDALIAIADGGAVELIVKGVVDDERRGYLYSGDGGYESDRSGEFVTTADLDAGLALGAELTWTLVPDGMGRRTGIDQDEDGFLDRDELDGCSDPADANSTPDDPGCVADIAGGFDDTGDGTVDALDYLRLIGEWGKMESVANIDCLGDVDALDFLLLIAQWGDCPVSP